MPLSCFVILSVCVVDLFLIPSGWSLDYRMSKSPRQNDELDDQDLFTKADVWDSVPKSNKEHDGLPLDAESAKYLEKIVSKQNQEKEITVPESLHANKNDSDHHPSLPDHGGHSTIHVASWQWDYVRTPLIYTVVVIGAGLCKIGFHHAGFLSSILPESCMLIMLGIVVGAIVHFTHSRELLPQFTPKAFFLFLLPPIVLESAYSLHDRAFFSNLGTIIMYAVLGTLINCFSIGISLYGLSVCGALGTMRLNAIECLVFSALISAVDPVAVLAIFQEVGVNKSLYFLVFGESLLNDAVTIVLYMMMVIFSKADTITADQVGLGVAAFICVSLGGLAIGILMGVVTALITKHTKDVRVVEPLAMLGIAYLSYLLAEMVHFSGIISIIGCGIVQAHYASKNISQKSNTTVKYFTKMVSAVCDTVIFLFLGMVLVDDQHIWHMGFVLWTTGFCFAYRFMAVFFLTYCANKFERTHKINAEEQFIMAYGGLRGAVAFSLVVMLEDMENKQLFITTTLFIILFTVFIQGATIKPLVSLLKIRRQASKTSSMFTEVNKKLLDHVMAGVEEVTGDHGGNYWKQLLFHYNSKYLKKWLQCNYKESNLSRVYTRMMLEDHFAHLYGPATAIEDQKPLLLHRSSGDHADVLEDLPLLDEDEEEDTIGKFGSQERQRKDVTLDESEEESKPLKSKTPARRRMLRFAQGAAKHLRIPLHDMSRSPSSTSTGVPAPMVKRQTTLNVFRKSEEDDPSKLLQKALSGNPYNKLHRKYNPNLVGDEDQDMASHLRLRRLRARRLTLLAMHAGRSDQAGASKKSSSGNEEIIESPAVISAASFFLERAQKRRSWKKDGKPKTPEQETPPLDDEKNAKPQLERQTAFVEVKDISEPELAKVVEEPEETLTVVTVTENGKLSIETKV